MDFTADMSSIEQKMIRWADQSRKPISGSLELTPLCNMNCDMCYVRLDKKNMEQQGRLRTVEEWMNIAKEMKDEGVLFLLLTGGEPLLYPGFKELYLGLKSLGMIITINTNGTLINKEWANFFGTHQPRRINITLYGSCKETYKNLCHYEKGFTKALEGIKMLREVGVAVKIAGSATKANRDDIESIIYVAKDLNVPVTIDTYMMPSTRERNQKYSYETRLLPEEAAKIRIMALRAEMGEERFAEYRKRKLWEVENILPEDQPMGMSCHAGRSSFTINWQGKIRPCVIMDEPERSVFQDGFKGAWNHLSEKTNKITLNIKCSSCSLRPLCRTCAACALLEGGAYNAVPEYMCRYAKETWMQLNQIEDKENRE